MNNSDYNEDDGDDGDHYDDDDHYGDDVRYLFRVLRAQMKTFL